MTRKQQSRCKQGPKAMPSPYTADGNVESTMPLRGSILAFWVRHLGIEGLQMVAVTGSP